MSNKPDTQKSSANGVSPEAPVADASASAHEVAKEKNLRDFAHHQRDLYDGEAEADKIKID